MMKNLFLLVTLLFAVQFSFGQDEVFKKDVMKLIQINGTDGQVKMVKSQVLKMLAPEKHAAFIIEFDATLPGLYENWAKTYMETYSKDDVKAMLAFYETPIGKKIQSKSVELLEKNQTATQEWGQGLQAMMMKYMQ
jgi:hypothetical protein